VTSRWSSSPTGPKTVANFRLPDDGYDGTVFHRVIKDFMVQGGGFDKSYSQKPTRKPIENEAKNGLKNDVGTVAMARTSDPHSASAQFFINVKNNDFLNYPGQDGWGYAVFGKVVDGMDVVTKIAKTPTGSGGPFRRTRPRMVVIESVTLVADKSEVSRALFVSDLCRRSAGRQAVLRFLATTPRAQSLLRAGRPVRVLGGRRRTPGSLATRCRSGRRLPPFPRAACAFPARQPSFLSRLSLRGAKFADPSVANQRHQTPDARRYAVPTIMTTGRGAHSAFRRLAT
jgi:cyclophilin family peptidyl-prolyl cis-trans isomerase